MIRKELVDMLSRFSFNKKENIKEKAILLLIIVCNVVFMLFWGQQKNNFYWDEFHTYKNAHDVTGSGSFAEYISDVFEENVWINNRELKSIYCVSDNEAVSSVRQFFANFIGKQNFPILFNLYEAKFFNGQMNKWAGVSLNIIFLEITLFIMYHIARKYVDRKYAYAVVVLYGFSGIAVSMTMFVRSYSFTILLMAITILCHAYIW